MQDLENSSVKDGLRKIFLMIGIIYITCNWLVPTALAELDLETNYHVYVDDAYIGIVTDEEIVESALSQKIAKAEEQYPEFEMAVTNDISYIPEQVFRSKAVNSEVVEHMNELANVEAIATALTIEGEPVVYLKDMEAANDTLKELKLQYISKKELAMLETSNRKVVNKVDTSLIDLEIEEEISLEQTTVDPVDVLNVKEALKLLQKGTLEDKKHEVVEGEVLGKIAAQYDLTTEQLIELNEGLTEDSILQIGQELNTVVTKPLIHIIVEKEVTEEKSVDFEIEIVEDSSMLKGESKIKQEGKKGKSAFTYAIVEKNGKQIKKEVIDEVVIEKPVKQITVKGTKVIPSRGSGSFAWPTNGGYVSSKMGQRWGRLHKGIDIARPSNYTIKAVDHGIVVSAGWDSGGYGNKIIIDHQNGIRTLYAHLKSINVSVGQKVEKGSSIGVMGNTGNSKGVHLHFEVYKNGKLQNPLNYLK